MGFLDSLGKTVESFGKAAVAGPGAIYDIASTYIPGDQWGDADDEGFSSLLDNLGGRGLDIIDPFSNGNTITGKAFGGVMHGLGWAYHEAVDRPLSTAWTVMDQVGLNDNVFSADYGSILDGDTWSKAYAIADQQSIGQSIVADASSNLSRDSGLGESSKPFDDWDKGTTPFAGSEFNQEHPTLANLSALTVDVGVSWFLDPAVVVGKAAGAAHTRKGLGKLKDEEAGNLGQLIEDGAEATSRDGLLGLGGKAPNWGGRMDTLFDFVNGGNKEGKVLNGAEIYAVTKDTLGRSKEGKAIAGALGDTLKLTDDAAKKDAFRRVLAVAAGDETQIARLQADINGGAALADKLRNISQQSTVQLTRQALERERIFDPNFNALMTSQVKNLDETGEVTAAVKAFEAQTLEKIKGQETLLAAQRTMGYFPRATGRAQAKLNAAQGSSKMDKLENAHDKAVGAVVRSDSFSMVFQKGLHSVPLLAVYPTKWVAATLPTKTLPAFVRNMKQTHFHGVVSLHDWDGATTQLDSMMRLAGVDDTTRLAELSKAYRVSHEMDKMGTIEHIENVAINAIAARVSAATGKTVDARWVKQTMTEGQTKRMRASAAMDGGRLYAATVMPEDMALRSRNLMVARQEAKLDDKLAAEGQQRAARTGIEEQAEAYPLRVDSFIESSGTPVSLPLVSSQLANRVPLFDVHTANKLVSDKAWAQRFAAHSEMATEHARDLAGLEARLTRATGSGAKFLERHIENKRKMLDALTEASSFMNRWWKLSVLFRLGYPMRVLADDHMRIAARINWFTFLGANAGEAASNSLYNHLPGRLGGRAKDGRELFAAAKRQREAMKIQMGRDTWYSDDELDELKALRKAVFGKKTPVADRATARARMSELDPQGRAHEYYQKRHAAAGHRSAIRLHQRNITKWEAEEATPEVRQKIENAREALAEREAALDVTVASLNGLVDPQDLHREVKKLNVIIDSGARGVRPAKKHIGQRDIVAPDGTTFPGAFAGSSGGAYREATRSNASFNMLVTDGEKTTYNMLSTGDHTTVVPPRFDEQGRFVDGHRAYYHVWESILNHQVRNSPEYMAILRGDVKTPDEFVKWIAKDENRHLRQRVRHYAHDPEDWAHRLFAVVDDYLPTQELRDRVATGQVRVSDLKTMFPKGSNLPVLHGQVADIQSGRAHAVAAFSNGVHNAFRYLSEVPTDHLSRHPFFNAVYQHEIKKGWAVKGGTADGSRKFAQKDIDEIERAARQNALQEVKRTLWDVSAHSHAAHTMRFLSPFFAAHQEALTRWWNIVTEDPSVVRRFQLAFDIPRKAGLTYNPDTGEVKEGESIGPGNHIMLKLPFAGDDNPVNKWLLKMGGGNYWNINENGLNLILQNGLANPGVGPVVTIPVETLAIKNAESANWQKAARVLNQYPPMGEGFKDIAVGALSPAWSKRMMSYFQGEGSAEYARYYMTNLSDGLISWQLANPGAVPTEAEFDDLMERADHETHTELLMMAASNALSITPAKPNSKFAVVQNGLSRLYEQMRTEGHDMEWLRENFRAKYRDVYLPMIYSLGDNPSGLDSTAGVVSAAKTHKRLLGKVDTSLYRMVVGPDAQDDETYSPAARNWLRSQGLIGSKDLDEAAASLIVNQGWRQYEELTNYLDLQAEQMGVEGYENVPQLVEAKKAGLAYIKQENAIFAYDYESWDRESFDAKVDDMRQIVSDRRLSSDPTRGDIYWLGQYVMLRDTITAAIQQRAADGGNTTIGAKSNADLAAAFRAGVSYINGQSSYFKTYSYSGIIENDPYLLGEDAE